MLAFFIFFIIISLILLVIIYRIVEKKNIQIRNSENAILELNYQIKSLNNEIALQEKNFNQKLANEIEKELLKFQAKEAMLLKDKENQEVLMKKFQENIDNTVKQLKEDTSKIASAIVHDSREKTIVQSKEMIEKLVNPLDKNIQEFREKFIQNEESFKTQIGQMSSVTDRLNKIFRSSSKNQGKWGEDIIEKILETIGLKRGIDYHKELSLETENDENKKRPDFIMNLPNENHIVIDAKVSFDNWEKYILSKEQNSSEMEVQENLSKFFKNIEEQINSLAKKEYEKYSLKKMNNKSIIRYVLMFIPIEGMFAEIVNNSNLFDKALERNIIIVSRASLMPALFLVKEIIDKQKQRENLEEIIKLAEAVYDRFRLILQNANDTEKSLIETEKHIQESRKSLETMKKRIQGETLLKDLKKMKSLGVNGKDLPHAYNTTNVLPENEIQNITEEENIQIENKKDTLL